MGYVLNKKNVTQWGAKLLVQSFILRNIKNKRKNAPVIDKIKLKTGELLLDGYKKNKISVLSGFLLPAEMLHLYGVSPMFTEFLAPITTVTNRSPDFLRASEIEGMSRDTCTFHRSTLGAYLEHYLPDYQLVVGTSHLCDGQNKTLEEMANRMRAPYILIDVPQYDTPDARDYLAWQLQELEDKLIELTGRQKATSRDWERVMAQSNRSRELLLRMNELRSRPGSFLYGVEGFNLNLISLLLMGTQFLTDNLSGLVRELESCCTHGIDDDSCYRILWLLAYPYVQDYRITEMAEEMGIKPVMDELSSVSWEPLDPANPYYSLAGKILQSPFLGSVENRIRNAKDLIQEHNVDGVLHFSHWGCRQGCGAVRALSDKMDELGVPFLELHGDCIDDRQFGEGQIKTRLASFAELMKRTRTTGNSVNTDQDSLYLGIDVGSETAKAVLVDANQNIYSREVFYTGASAKKAISRLYEHIYSDRLSSRIKGCVATGYGRNAVFFADEVITEITCHARGMAHSVQGVRTIIDIGGQDTKAIAVDQNGGVRKFLMNDKCAAGTGRFLEMMARTLEVDLDDLGPLALRADYPANITSLCSVFAESEVISHIAEDTPMEVIARGVCSSIAQRTLSLLERVGKEEKFAMSGGVAKNTGVVKELERSLGNKLQIPEDPHTIGALGAAMFAADQQ